MLPASLDRLCIHTITTKPWAIETSAAKFAAAGVKGITVWRDTLAGRDIKKTGQMLRDHGLAVVSLCRGGFFPGKTAAERQKALDDNRLAIAEAHALGAPHIVLVCGAVPGQPLTESRKQILDGIAAVLPDCQAAGVKLAIEPLHPMYAADRRKAIDDNRLAIAEAHALGAPHIVLVCGAVPGLPLAESRKQILDGIAALLPECRAADVKLAIEPLHPMYADSRSAVNTLAQANDMVEQLNSPWVGVAVDVYHLWWDPALQQEIARCGRLKALFAYHVCDWRTPTTDLLLDRGLMGEGCIPLRQIRAWVEATGFMGLNEVEVFSARLWTTDQDEYLKQIVQAYRDHV